MSYVLDKVASANRLGLLTDGSSARQLVKLDALGIDGWFDGAIYTHDWESPYRKPGPRGFRALEEQWELPARRMVYVADNPAKDFIAPRSLGWTAIRLRVPGQLTFDREPATDAARAHQEVRDGATLLTVLRTLADRG